MKKILITLMFIFMASTVYGATVPEVTYVWTAPTTGSPVAQYVVQFKVNELDWVQIDGSADTTFTFSNIFEYGQTYMVRVAGIDAELRQGPWSLPSTPYTPDAGAPGTPGQPVFLEVQ